MINAVAMVHTRGPQEQPLQEGLLKIQGKDMVHTSRQLEKNMR